MTLELVIFIIVAAVAIFSAALMLVSRNAVHSALFLVTNFICVAFFYLLLNAPFLAMIQVTVYAGAIMVLFMFVIMLLGAERLGTQEPRYRWLAPAAVGLTTVFLVVAFLVVVQGNVGLLQPVPHDPEIRFVHAAGGVPAVDVYLNNDRVAHNVTYREPTEFVPVHAGQYNALVFPACTEADPTRCADPFKTGAAPLVAMAVKLDPETHTSYIVAGAPGQLQLIAAPMDLKPVDDENTARLTAVNAYPGDQPVKLAQINRANAADIKPLTDDLAYGTVSKPAVLPKGNYELAWVRGIERVMPVDDLNLKNKTHELIILASEIPAGQALTRPTVIRVAPTPIDEVFGSPQQIGQSLFSVFLLPFELVSLLLLAAMVGAIILTREDTAKRVRQRLVVSPVVRRINRAIASSKAEGSSD